MRRKRAWRLRKGRIAAVLFVLVAGASSLSLAIKAPDSEEIQVKPPVLLEVEVAQTPVVVTPTPTEQEEEDEFVLYDIALGEELQRFTYDRCEELGLSYELVLAIMFKESSYQPDVVNSSECYGLMQIHKVNHPALTEALGITDFLDPKQNIIGGTYFLAQIAEKYSDVHEILMVYNCGESGAKKLWAKGITDTAYSRGVVKYMEGLEVA